MRKSDFGYELPPALIAQTPLPERDKARLLHVRQQGVEHRCVSDLASLLTPDDLVVVNNTRVLNARLRGVKDTGGMVEILVERVEHTDRALCQVRSSKALKTSRTVEVNGEQLQVLGRQGQFHRLRFPAPVVDFLDRFGETPLPPYIRRAANAADRARYQTVFASAPGAVAAPTAGLHLSAPLLKRIRQRCAGVVEITLHIGAGTFQTVHTEDLSAHRLHAERFEVSAAAADRLEVSREGPGRIVAIGTTVVRALETLMAEQGCIRPCCGETRLFIRPGFRFRIVDALLTNFHLPESTLLMLVCAFAGHQRIKRAYERAIKAGYRFFSYGDAMFTERWAD